MSDCCGEYHMADCPSLTDRSDWANYDPLDDLQDDFDRADYGSDDEFQADDSGECAYCGFWGPTAKVYGQVIGQDSLDYEDVCKPCHKLYGLFDDHQDYGFEAPCDCDDCRPVPYGKPDPDAAAERRAMGLH